MKSLSCSWWLAKVETLKASSPSLDEGVRTLGLLAEEDLGDGVGQVRVAIGAVVVFVNVGFGLGFDHDQHALVARRWLGLLAGAESQFDGLRTVAPLGT